MGLRLGRTGLVFNPEGRSGPVWFADAVLRGVAQVIFVNNSYTGLLCLAAILVGAPAQMVWALVCTAVGTGVGLLLGADREDVGSGLYGYNGCLIAIAVPLFLGPGVMVLGLSLLATGLSSVLLRVLLGTRPLGLPALTAPFVLGTWLVVWMVQAMAPARQAGPPLGTLRDVPVPPAGPFDGWPLVEAALTGIGQVYLQPAVLSGLLVALAVLVASWRMFLLAVLAAVAGAGSAMVLGLPVEAIRTGLFGFNAVLAALALGLVYLRPGFGPVVLALVAAMLMPVVQISVGHALIHAGLPTMSVPFIATTWIVLAVLRPFARLRPA